MSTAVAPTLNANVPIFIKVATDLLVGAIIRNSNPQVEASRAQAVTAVGQALVQAGSGDVTDAMTALDAAIAAVVASKTQDPAAIAVATTAITWIASKATIFQTLLSGTAAGALAATILGQVGTEAVALAKQYMPAATTTTTAA